MRGEALWALLLLVGVTTAGVPAGAVADGGPPLADAGLDQTVNRGATVYLDGRGSTAPDGEITAYRWRITTPPGGTTAPDDPTAARTEFVAGQTGTYEVTLEVTDDEGRTATDTLYVEVEPPAPPSVTLDGPGSATTIGTETYTARVDPGDNPVETIVWSVDDTEVARGSLAGIRATRAVDFSTAGTVDVAATVIDSAGERDTARLTVTVAGFDPGSESDPTRPPESGEESSGTEESPTDDPPTEPDVPADAIQPIEEPSVGEPEPDPNDGLVEPEVGSPQSEPTQSGQPNYMPWALTSTGAISEGVSMILDKTDIAEKPDNNKPNKMMAMIDTMSNTISDGILGTDMSQSSRTTNYNRESISKVSRNPGSSENTNQNNSNTGARSSSQGMSQPATNPISPI